MKSELRLEIGRVFTRPKKSNTNFELSLAPREKKITERQKKESKRNTEKRSRTERDKY